MEINQKNFLFALSKIRQRLFAYLEAELAKNGITDIPPSYGDILFVLDKKGPLTLQEIVRYAVKDKSTVSSVLKRLEEKGYVVKEKNKDDGRFVKIRLAARVRKKNELMYGISSAMNERLFNGLSGEEKTRLFELLGRVYGNIC